MKYTFLLALLLTNILQANDDTKYDEMFLDSLNEVSEIATKTKLNIDDMPAFVTILHRDKMESLGISTVYEALGLVPGVELSIEASGAKEVIFRGVKEKGKVKLMIDGVSINNAYRASIYYYLDFPIELVDRIEVVRGPGSVIYGSNAISGVINIVTSNASDMGDSEIFMSASSYDDYKVGTHVSHTLGDVYVSADAYYRTSNKHLDAGPDTIGQYGSSDERLEDASVGLHVKRENFDINARIKQSDTGLAYGFGYMLTPANDNESHKNRSIFVQGQYANSINSNNHYTISLGYTQYAQKISTQFAPTTPPVLYDNDYEEEGFNTKVEYVSKSFENQEILFGAEMVHVYALKQNLHIQNHPQLDPSLLLKEGSVRNISSLYMDDQISLSQYLQVSLGLRYDYYSDFGDAFSPRLALVAPLSDTTTLKVMYSRAFRAPSWIELYAQVPGVSLGNENLEPEKSDTFELGAIYTLDKKSTMKFNVYATRISNILYKTDLKQYDQDGYNDFIGSEVEWQYVPIDSLQLNMNLGYVHAADDNDTTLADIANFLANASVIYDFDNGVRSATLYKFVGQRERELGDSRDTLDGYHLLDQSFSLTYNDMTFMLSVKNIFDADIRYPSPASTYSNDFVREGRIFMGRVSWKF